MKAYQCLQYLGGASYSVAAYFLGCLLLYRLKEMLIVCFWIWKFPHNDITYIPILYRPCCIYWLFIKLYLNGCINQSLQISDTVSVVVTNYLFFLEGRNEEYMLYLLMFMGLCDIIFTIIITLVSCSQEDYFLIHVYWELLFVTRSSTMDLHVAAVQCSRLGLSTFIMFSC